MLDYKFFNPNPRGAITGDCVKRAIVAATGKDYKELELFMNRNKVKKNEPYNDKANYEHVIMLLGGDAVKCSVPAGTKRWHVKTIDKVMKDYPNVSYVLAVSKHLIGVKDNTIYDLFDDRPRDKGIYKMYVFNASANQLKNIRRIISYGDYNEFNNYDDDEL